MKKILTLSLSLLLILTLAACGRTRDSEKPLVITTLFPQYDIARSLAGDYIDLEFLLTPGTDAHSFEPSPRRVVQILEADLLIYTGDAMEPWVSRLIAPAKDEGLNILDLSRNINLITTRHHQHNDTDHHDHDDHHHHDEETEIGEFILLNRRNDQEEVAYVHGNHWHGRLPSIEVGASLSLGAHIVSIDDRHRELDSEGEINGLSVSLYSGAESGIVEFAEHGDHVHVIGVKEGITQIVFHWTHRGEVRYTTPPIQVVVGDEQHDHGLVDPHIWTDPLNVAIMTMDIRNALITLLPEYETEIRQNAEAYLNELDEIHEAFLDLVAKSQLNTIMYGGHNAMGYFIARYNLNYVNPYRGFSTDAEPTPQALAEMINRMREYNIQHLFSEKLIAPHVANAIAEETNATILYVYAMENAPRDEFNAGITLFDMFRHNLEVFKIGLDYRP